MSFRIELDTRNLRLFREGSDLMRRKVKTTIKRATALLLRRIIQNTNRGIDANGNSFLPYSSSYIKQRVQKGLGTLVNLQDTSQMIQSFVITKINDYSYRIHPAGLDSNGVSNSVKLYYIENGNKQRLVLYSSDKYKEMVKSYIQRNLVAR